MSGLNAPLKRLVVTAPLCMGCHGKWLDVDALMSYAVLQAGALPNAGAASHAAGSVVPKTASAGGQKQKKRKSNGLGNGAAKADTSGKVGKGQSQKKPRKASVHNDHMKEWLKETTAATIAANLGILPSTASQKL